MRDAVELLSGEGQAITTVFQAIHDGRPDQSLLSYQYLQMLPRIAEGDANKVWIVPSEIGRALEGLGTSIGNIPGIPKSTEGVKQRVDMGEPVEVSRAADSDLQATHDAVKEAIAEAQQPPPPAPRA